ncbi:MAG TPA: hypothetical protein VHC19_09240, partial [Pirellulales bacterium]|nr:hypothetical protein [Pirellulales bacterium]
MDSIIIFRTVGERIACDAVVMELLGLAFPSGTPSNEQIAQFKLRVRLPGWASDGTKEIDVTGYDGCYVSDLRTFADELRECLGGGRNQAILEGYTALFRLQIEPRLGSDSALVLGRIRAPACVPEDWSQRARFSMEHKVMDFPFSL